MALISASLGLNQMLTIKQFNKFLLLVLLAGLSLQLFAKQFYRYRNDEGKLIVKDQVNNEMVTLGYEVINENGALVKTVGPGKTLAQLEEEKLKQVEAKRAEYQLKQKIRHDAELLRQFSSISDIIRNRDAQLLALEQRIKIQRSKSNLLKLQLEDQQKQAATHERLGQKLPKILQQDIAATRTQITNNQKNSTTLEEEKQVVAGRYESDIIRYRELESFRKNFKNNDNENKASEPVTYDCTNARDCQKAWQLAQIYANDNASGQIEIITNTLILTSKPEEDTDLALSFSRIPTSNNMNQIMLEITCNNSEQGAELCKSKVVRNLKKGYLKKLVEVLE